MALFSLSFHLVHSWHDAGVLIFFFWGICFPVTILLLALRVQYVSLPKREARFKSKR